MRHAIILTVTLHLLPAVLPAAAAADPMTGAEFEAATTGKTFTFAANGTVYGAEQYLTGRRVMWSFVDGQDSTECRSGTWYPEARSICFQYEDEPATQCWQFFDEPAGLRATFQGDGQDDGSITTLYEARATDDPLQCLGPEIGVTYRP